MQSRMHSGNTSATAPNGPAGFRFSTDNLPPHFRVSVLNRTLARGILGSQISEVGDRPLEAVVVECSLPGLSLHWANSSPIHAQRTGPPGQANGSDCIFFGAVNAQRISTQFGRAHSLGTGEGIVVGSPGAADTIYPFPCRHLALIVPRNAMIPRLRDKSTHFVRSVPPDNGAMQLLVSYLDALKDLVVAPELEHAVVAHVHDLLAVVLGATPDATEIAGRRGIRAARLRAIEKDVLNNLRGDLSVSELAGRHRLTERYVQMLFDDGGTTFTCFVRDRRLDCAHNMLISPRFDHMRITEIALDVGFGDLSYFNRVFRRRFGMSPRDVRSGSGGNRRQN